MSTTLVPLFAIVFTFGSVIAIVAISLKFKARKIEHEEIMKALELGQELPTLEVKKRSNYLQDLRNGIIWLAVGVGIMVFFQAGDYDMERYMGIGAIPAFIGLGMITIAIVTKNISDREKDKK